MNKDTKPQCPYCQSFDVADIMYGEPAFSDELNKALSNGEIYLGGCCYYLDSPKYHCNKCGKNFPESEHDPDWGLEFETDDGEDEEPADLLKIIEEANERYFKKQQEILQDLADEAYNGDINEAKKHYNDWLKNKVREATCNGKILNYDDLKV